MPWITIVIPCFNAAKWVSEAIDSVLSQNVDGVEIVVVNDGSTDETPRLLEAYGKNIHVIHQANGGVVSARRAGVAEGSGTFIKFLDADDIVPQGALKSLYKVALMNRDEVFIGRAVVMGDQNDSNNQIYGIGYQPDHLSEVKKEFLLTQATSSSLWVIPRKLFGRFELFSPDVIQMGEEFDFCMRLIESNIGIRYVDVLVSQVRVHDSPGRLSRSTDEGRHLAQASQIESVANFIRERIPDYSPMALERTARMCWSRGRSCLRIECAVAGERYFELARSIDPNIRPVGSTAYRALCEVLGPAKSEAALQKLKLLLKSWKRQ